MAIRKSTKYIVVHVTATPPKADIGAKEVRVMHLARGFNDIGYHYVIRRNGEVELGRTPDTSVGAHVQGYNSVSVGVSLVGGVDVKGKPEHNATPAQMKTLENLLRKLQIMYSKAGICGHRDLSPDKDGDGIIEPFEHIKACPCFDAIPWAKSKGLRVADIKGVWKPLPVAAAPAKPVAPAPTTTPAPTPPVDTHSQTEVEQVKMTPAKVEQSTKITKTGTASIISLITAAVAAAWAYFVG